MVFVVALFFIKNNTVFKKDGVVTSGEEGLTYNTEILVNLISKDSDGDGVEDWEEGLWETDPKNKDTDGDGITDNTEIESLKLDRSKGVISSTAREENLTETDKFARELFTTVASLNQAGQMDLVAVDKLTSALASQMEDAAPRKVFNISEIRVVHDSTQAFQDYYVAIGTSFSNHTIYVSPAEILAESMKGGEDIDVKVLYKLDPIIKHFQGIVSEMKVMAVPQPFTNLHLNVMNDLQKVTENLIDMKLFEADVIVAMGAMIQYAKNDEDLKVSMEQLISGLSAKLNG